MNITINEPNNFTVLALEGRLDSNTSENLNQQLTKTMDNGQQQLIVDFSQLTYISSAGLRVLLMTAKRLKIGKGALILCSMKEHIREVFEVSGFLQILTVVDTQQEAEAALAGLPAA